MHGRGSSQNGGVKGISMRSISVDAVVGIDTISGGSNMAGIQNLGTMSISNGSHNTLGLEEGLMNLGMGSHGSNNGLLSIDGLLSKDRLSGIGGLNNGSGLDMGNGGRLMNMGSFSHGEGSFTQLRSDHGVGMSLSGGVSKVAAQTVGLNGSRVMRRGSDHSGRTLSNGTHGHDAGIGHSQDGGEDNKGLEKMGQAIKCLYQRVFQLT